MLLPSLAIMGSGLVAIAGLRVAMRNPSLALVVAALGGGVSQVEDPSTLPGPLAQIVEQVHESADSLSELRAIADRTTYRHQGLADHEMADQYYESRDTFSNDINDADRVLRNAFGDVTG